MLHIATDERRARIGLRHRLAPSARTGDDVAAIAGSVVVLHATDPATFVLSATARMQRPEIDAVARALYDDRSVVRMLGMRRTMFIVPAELAPVVHASSTVAIAAKELRKLVAMVETSGVAVDGGRWLRGVEKATMAALADLGGQATGAELSKAVPALATKVTVAEGKSWGATISLTTRVLTVLSAEGSIVRGRPKGSWISSQHRWAPMAGWFDGGLAAVPVDEARVAIVRRWLERFGPGTIADLKWWTGWTLGQVRAALTGIDTVPVDLDGTEGIILADDIAPVVRPAPWVALLPGLDATTMGWVDRAWYLGEHKPHVFDRNGNAGPTIWADGRIVGGWAQRKDGQVVTRLLEDIGRAAARRVDAEAARLQELIGPARITPRFPAPLDRELSR